MADEQTQTLNIDGTKYSVADLADNAHSQVVNLCVTDADIEKLKQPQAIGQTARTAYARALSEALSKK